VDTDTFTIDLKTQYDMPVTGFVKADFTLDNVTDESTVTITDVEETSDGRYVFTIPAQTNDDVLQLFAEKARYDCSAVEDLVITVVSS